MHNKAQLFLIIVLLSYLPLGNGDSVDIPRNNPIPGGVAVVTLGSGINEPPIANFGDKKLLVRSSQSNWVAIVGLPMDILPGKYIVTYQSESEEKLSVHFQILPLPADKGHRTVKLPDNLGELNFDATDNDYINNELQLSEEIDAEFKFQQIVNSGSYIPFGRIIKNQSAGEVIEHPWITYITNIDELVRSPGIVIVERIYLSDSTGISVGLNHGGGLRSVLSHLEDVIVKPGERLHPGDAIGTALTIEALSVGRVDWKLLLNQYYIDPLQFTPTT